MQLLAKFKKILYMGFRATLNFRVFGTKTRFESEAQRNIHPWAGSQEPLGAPVGVVFLCDP